VDLQVVATDHAMHFFDRSALPVRVFCDTDEWQVVNLYEQLNLLELKWLFVVTVLNTIDGFANTVADLTLTTKDPNEYPNILNFEYRILFE